MDNNIRLKLCSGCKTMIPKDNKTSYCSKCSSKRRKEHHSIYAKENDIYGSVKWKNTRKRIRQENVFCEVCQEIGYKGILATEVHHIIKVIHGDDSTHYDPSNLISVCNRHHKMIENMSKEQLIKALMDGSLL